MHVLRRKEAADRYLENIAALQEQLKARRWLATDSYNLMLLMLLLLYPCRAEVLQRKKMQIHFE